MITSNNNNSFNLIYIYFNLIKDLILLLILIISKLYSLFLSINNKNIDQKIKYIFCKNKYILRLLNIIFKKKLCLLLKSIFIKIIKLFNNYCLNKKYSK